MRLQLGAAPSRALDPATKGYVDSAISGISGGSGGSGSSGTDSTAEHFKGTWVYGSYNPNDVVIYNGATYICTTAVNAVAPTYVGSSSLTSGSGQRTIPLPSGCAVGDICILAVSSYGGSSGTAITLTNSTSLLSATSGVTGLAVSSYTLTASDISTGSLTFTGSSSAGFTTLQVFRNVTVGVNASGTSSTMPTVTTTAASFVVKIAAQLITNSGPGQPTFSPAQTNSVAPTVSSAGGSYQATLIEAYENQSNAGTSSAATAVLSGNDAGQRQTFVVALAKASASFPAGSFTALPAPLPGRATVSVTSVSIASGATDTTTSPVIGLGFTLYAVQASRPARIQLYSTAAAMAADANRAVGTDPQPYDSGIILDYVTPDAKTHILSPMVPGANMESTPTTSISMRVTNNDTVTGTVSVTFTFLRTE